MNIKKSFALVLAGTVALGSLLALPAFASENNRMETEAGIEFVWGLPEGIFPGPDPDPEYDHINATSMFFGVRNILTLGTALDMVLFNSLDRMGIDTGHNLVEEIADYHRFIEINAISSNNWELVVKREDFVQNNSPVMPNAELRLQGSVYSYIFNEAELTDNNVIVTDVVARVALSRLGATGFRFAGTLEMPVEEANVGDAQTIITWELRPDTVFD